MEKIIKGLTKEQGYAVKEAIDSFKKNLVVVVDDDQLTIKDMDWSEVKRCFEVFEENDKKRNARFIKEYLERHPEYDPSREV